MDFKRLVLQAYPQAPERQSSEARWWKRYKAVATEKKFGAVSHIEFSPAAPHAFAVTAGSRVHVYSAATKAETRTLTRFPDTAYCGTWRGDGKILAAGSEDGLVQLFDASSRLILRKLKGHTRAVRALGFGSKSSLYTASDDFTARIWDVPTETSTMTLSGHTDVVRSATLMPGSEHLLLTGSYDHSIMLWDTRTGSSTLSLDGGGPLEALLVLPSSGLVVSAALNSLSVWDILAGGKKLLSVSNHRKTITALALDSTGARLLSASLDQQVKVYDVTDYSVTHTIKFESPLLSLALAPDNSLLVAGGVNGELAIREHKQGGASAADMRPATRAGSGDDAGPSAKKLHPGSHAHAERGQSHKPEAGDFVLASFRRKKLRDFERFLKKFEYKNALDAALNTRDPVVVVSLIAELKQRAGLNIALKGRDDTSLEPILEFLIRYAVVPRYAPLLLDVAATVLEMYAPFIGQFVSLDEQFVQLAQQTRREVAFLRDLHSMQGMLEVFLEEGQRSAPRPSAAPAPSTSADTGSRLAQMEYEEQ
ncbi:U3 small nucleolar RNA-associated protein [Thecamonas trahens ATCC 50062]|uniref:U3 small nucleolar RNA-associated protein n=1 Tax=Thecamonas trahens ATCC 50062 TaxID=461836 RepID=A0A0L0DGF8_THETB|nr:U3 small nucleolar RNA-associated protein [Thecamonas trahens ATCC 50062]KNC51417.1 U3 small nucleolar RNA-associated protein [Thecamonas trahens ATCC 50062]|eukprot:XP_013756083.1 U3 small nucleolar RNA-associated protein [Thecamonas trahens ATCC 50062]